MKKIAAVFALTFALAFGLASCGGAAPEDFTPRFVGSWELIRIEGGETNFTESDFEMLKDMNMTCTLDLEEDGTYKFDLFGQTMSETWEATSAEAATLAMSGQQVEVTLVGDNLILKQEGAETYTFAKAEVAATSSGAASSVEAGDVEAATSDAEAVEGEAEEGEATASSAA